MTTPTQPMRKTLTVSGLALRYLEWGAAEAPPIVCVHGYTGSADAFNALARQKDAMAYRRAMSPARETAAASIFKNLPFATFWPGAPIIASSSQPRLSSSDDPSCCAAATSLFSIIVFIVLAMTTGLISANVRKLADRFIVGAGSKCHPSDTPPGISGDDGMF